MADKQKQKGQWQEVDEVIRANRYDFGVIASFGHMIPSFIIDRFQDEAQKSTMMVMHPSLLPKYRGACPIQYTILGGETEAGVSIIEISKGKFDAGKILLQKSFGFDWRTTKFSDLQSS